MRLRFAFLCVLVALPILPVASALGVTGNPADRLAELPIDDYSYDRARDCRKRPTPGALAVVDWLERNAQGSFWAIMRCERWGKDGASLHAEGRAWTGASTPRARPTAARRAA